MGRPTTPAPTEAEPSMLVEIGRRFERPRQRFRRAEFSNVERLAWSFGRRTGPVDRRFGDAGSLALGQGFRRRLRLLNPARI